MAAMNLDNEWILELYLNSQKLIALVKKFMLPVKML